MTFLKTRYQHTRGAARLTTFSSDARFNGDSILIPSVEPTTGFEPVCADLLSAALPFCHAGNHYVKLIIVYYKTFCIKSLYAQITIPPYNFAKRTSNRMKIPFLTMSKAGADCTAMIKKAASGHIIRIARGMTALG